MQTERIKYPMGALTAEGALIYDENVSGKRPAVLLAPNWMGVTDTAIQRGELVAENRYVVFVADMYGAGTRPADFGEAAALANPLRADAIEQRSRVKAAFETMIAQAQKRSLIDDRRAAVGFCFGGGNVLELARDGADLAAAVSIHGDLKTALPAGKGTIKAALLVVHGALDPVAPRADRDAFEAEMNAAGAKWQMVTFSGVLHAYTDQGADVPGIAAWDEPATRQTYALAHQFLADAFAARL
ncbi:MAG: dienelactone hydrolase family protein [Xanthobacteraceae bacterium]|jgi:dienelactone hydrolase